MTDAARARLDEYVRRRFGSAREPGLALALTDRERTLHAAVYGYADLPSLSPVTPETLFEIGSIGKTFTAVLILQLVEEGLVDLDAPVAEYLPWFEVRSRFAPITVRHLLTHSAGIINGSDITSDSRFDVYALRETDAGAPPGEWFRYSNVGYRALGFLLEEVVGKPYAHIVRGRILEPLEMTGSEPVITNATRARLATPHTDPFDDRPGDVERPLVPATWLETATGDGCQACTAPELAAFLRMLLDHGKGPRARLLSPESFDLVRGPWFDTGHGWKYGCGLGTFPRDGREVIGHGGDMVGYASTMCGDLQRGHGAVVLVNGLDDDDLTEDVALYALALLQAEAQGDELPVPEVPDRHAVAEAEAYAGIYRGRRRTLAFRVDGHGLALELDAERTLLEPRGTDRFRAGLPGLELYLLAFEREDGVPARVWYGGEEYVREGSAPVAQAVPPSWLSCLGHYRSYNPWLPSFRVVARGDRLVWIPAPGWERPLIALDESTFRVGDDERAAERLHFDSLAGSSYLRADLSGCAYYRVSTP